MKKLFVLLLVVVAACGSDDGGNPPPTPDVPDPGGERVFVQVEHLARPGINEALLISEAFHQGYNATAPSFAGVPDPVLQQVINEAKTVLQALYLGACLLNGALELSAANGVKPGGIQCHAVGGALFTNGQLDGETLTELSKTESRKYADVVFGLFIPDVMRIDTNDQTSTYERLCEGTGATVGLCGGRFLREDTIDITFDFLLNGARTCTVGIGGAPGNLCTSLNQVSALTSDGVAFDNKIAGNNLSARIPGATGNANQGHPDVSGNFPYSAAPF